MKTIHIIAISAGIAVVGAMIVFGVQYAEQQAQEQWMREAAKEYVEKVERENAEILAEREREKEAQQAIEPPKPLPPAEQPKPSPPAPQPEPEQPSCDPSYPDVCIPPYPPDLDCGEITHKNFIVGSDPHGFDRDNDGIGCES